MGYVDNSSGLPQMELIAAQSTEVEIPRGVGIWDVTDWVMIE